MYQGYLLTAAVKAGISLGAFDQIAAGNSTAAEIAAKVSADTRGTTILLDALAAIGLLELDDGRYRLASDAAAFLVRGRPDYIGDAVDVFVSPWHWDRLGQLADAVRNGGSVFAEDAETPGHPFWEIFAASYQRASHPTAEALSELLSPWAGRRRPLEVLDVACGGGLYAIMLGRRHPQARLTLLDQPHVLAITRAAVDEAGLGDRTQYLGGDMFDVPLGGPYDLVIASRVFHHYSPERCIGLLRRLATALKPDGKIAIHDFATENNDPADEPAPRLFSLIMLVWTREGRSYSTTDFERMLTTAGFRAPEKHHLPDHPTRLLIAERDT